MSVIDLVRIAFEDPEMTDACAGNILFSCTGYPSFFPKGNRAKIIWHQLRHAKRSLALGFSTDDIYTGKDLLIASRKGVGSEKN